jgi:hypothetical protein
MHRSARRPCLRNCSLYIQDMSINRPIVSSTTVRSAYTASARLLVWQTSMAPAGLGGANGAVTVPDWNPLPPAKAEARMSMQLKRNCPQYHRVADAEWRITHLVVCCRWMATCSLSGKMPCSWPRTRRHLDADGGIVEVLPQNPLHAVHPVAQSSK